MTQHQATVDSTLSEAIAINGSVVPNELPESNQKFINEVAYLYYKGGKDSIASYFSQVLDVANQCPYAGGKAVIQARVIASMFNDSIQYDDISVCLQAGYYRQAQNQQKEKQIPEFSVIPNPAGDKIEIKSNCNFEGICTIEITNALGSVVIKDEMNCKTSSHFISTSMLNDGVYFIKLHHESMVLNVQKLIIAR